MAEGGEGQLEEYVGRAAKPEEPTDMVNPMIDPKIIENPKVLTQETNKGKDEVVPIEETNQKENSGKSVLSFAHLEKKIHFVFSTKINK